MLIQPLQHCSLAKPQIQVSDFLTITPETSCSIYTAKFFSDTHFQTTHSLEQNGKAQGITLGQALRRTTKAISKCKKDIEPLFVSVGDTFGFLESWESPYMPTEADGSLINPDENLRVLREIANHNPVPMEEMRRFLMSSEHAKLILVEGNHDAVIFHLDSDNCRQFLAETLLPEASWEERERKIKFCKSGSIPVLGIQFEHGHRFDPFNYANGKRPWGDWVTVKSTLLLREIILKLKSCGLRPKVLNKMIARTERMLRLRPSTAFPLYLNYLSALFEKKYGKAEPNKVAKVREVLLSHSQEIGKLFEELPFIQSLKRRKLFPSPLGKFFRSSTFQKVFTKIVAMCENWKSDNNRPPLEECKRLAKETGINLFISGHTHKAAHIEEKIRGREVHYVNTGTWIPFKMVHFDGFENIFSGSTYPKAITTAMLDLSQSKTARYLFASEEEWKQKVVK